MYRRDSTISSNVHIHTMQSQTYIPVLWCLGTSGESGGFDWDGGTPAKHNGHHTGVTALWTGPYTKSITINSTSKQTDVPEIYNVQMYIINFPIISILPV